VILIPAKYAEIALGFDIIMLTIALVFRKSKHRTETSSLDRKSIGYYLVVSAIVALIAGHYASLTSYLDYYEGLAVDSFLFYIGLRMVTQSE